MQLPATTIIPAMGKANLEAFWNTELVSIGNYKLNIILNYDGKQTKEQVDIIVESNRIRAGSAAGRVVSETPEEAAANKLQSTILILAAVVLLLVIFNTYIYFKRIRPPKQPTTTTVQQQSLHQHTEQITEHDNMNPVSNNRAQPAALRQIGPGQTAPQQTAPDMATPPKPPSSSPQDNYSAGKMETFK